ncbi:PadR family transcriptional regulator [Pectinatus sottacetonis]|uniref:PadR family transcriptional regulator n=1 Tax=Pectinatus sottacetonis TaxID=1002795 RepID=UPI0018C5F087|nr:PadR family transcriptional regulator [Pectinatus sottacetonis]
MSLHYALLGMLMRKSMTGYQLKQKFESSIIFFWNAHISQIYRELNKMEKKHWVSFIIEPQSGKPDKKIYSITSSGKEEFIQWIRDFSNRPEETIKSELLTKIFFAENMEMEQLKYEFKRFIKDKQNELKGYSDIEECIKGKCDDKLYLFGNMTLQRGIKSAEADILWAEDCLNKIKEYILGKKGEK